MINLKHIFPRLDCRVRQYIGKGLFSVTILKYFWRFIYIRILEKKVLGHILPETMYLAMKCEHRSLIGESTIKILFHKPHTAFLIISPTGATFKARIILNGGYVYSS